MKNQRATTICPECGLKMLEASTTQTLGGYIEQLGHCHNDNCVVREYTCTECGAELVVSKRNRCPNPECDWRGRKTCWCHPGEKVDEWPAPYQPAEGEQ